MVTIGISLPPIRYTAYRIPGQLTGRVVGIAAYGSALPVALRSAPLALATDFPRLWKDPATPDRERKRMTSLLIDDVTITRGAEIALGVRLRGWATRRLRLAPELPPGQRTGPPTAVVAQIDNLLDSHTDAEIAALLNESGLRTGHSAYRP